MGPSLRNTHTHPRGTTAALSQAPPMWEAVSDRRSRAGRPRRPASWPRAARRTGPSTAVVPAADPELADGDAPGRQNETAMEPTGRVIDSLQSRVQIGHRSRSRSDAYRATPGPAPCSVAASSKQQLPRRACLDEAGRIVSVLPARATRPATGWRLPSLGRRQVIGPKPDLCSPRTQPAVT